MHIARQAHVHTQRWYEAQLQQTQLQQSCFYVAREQQQKQQNCYQLQLTCWGKCDTNLHAAHASSINISLYRPNYCRLMWLGPQVVCDCSTLRQLAQDIPVLLAGCPDAIQFL
jgi:hypothetical protein